MADGEKKRISHRFGGVWTEIKLRALTEYLEFYCGALKHKPFETWYVDAFAGTGDRHAEVEIGGLLENQPLQTVEQILDGSARKALRISPPFNHYWFSEKHQGRARSLQSLKEEFSPLDVRVHKGEANAGLQSLFSSPPWRNSQQAWKQRAVVFLDPYGMSVDWSTLKMLAATEAVDVWYLFPRKAVVQQLALNLAGVDNAKRQRLSQIFGCEDWEHEFYRSQPAQYGLFGDAPASPSSRIATAQEISEFARKRLKTIFSYVSQPLPLLIKNQDFFELYCLSNNKTAMGLIDKGVQHVIKKYSPASRHRSAPPATGR